MKLAARPQNPLEAVGLLAGQVPESVLEGFFGYMLSRTVMAATSLGVFEALAEKPDDAAGLASRLDLDEHGTGTLLTALHTMDYVRWSDERYANSRKTERDLLRSSKVPLTEAVGSFAYDMWDYFGQLEETLRTGEPVGLHERPPDDPFWERYMRGLFDFARLGGEAFAGLIPAENPRKMLDFAGGHGGYSMAMCRKHAGLEATILELEGSARIGEKIVAEEGFSDRVHYTVGDLFEVDLEGDNYDVALAAQILHHLDPDQCVELLGRAHGALRAGGTMAILEQERPAEGKRGQEIGVLTGLLFFISSRIRTYTADELAGFLSKAGFSGVRARHHYRFPGIVIVTGTA